MTLVPEPLADLAARQFGLVSRRQALEWWSRRQVAVRIDQGVIAGYSRGVYRFAGAAPSWRQRALGAVLTAGPPAAIHGLAAAYLWEVERIAPPAVSVAVPLGRSGRLAGGAAVRCAMPATDVVQRYGIPVTTPVRTVIDLSALVGPDMLGLVADDLIRRHLLEVATIQARLHVGGLGRHRCRALAELCEARRGDPARGASAGEDWVWDTIARAGLPLPVRHYLLWLQGRWAELDFAYPDRRIAVEYDSAEFHRDLRRFHGDRVRAAELALDDWLLLSITARWSEADVVERLGRAISARGLR